MQIASILYARVDYSPYFEYKFFYTEDDPQDPRVDGYEIDDNTYVPVVARPVWIHFNYKRDYDSEISAPILTKEQALEILQQYVTKMMDDEIKKLETQQEHLYILKYKAHNTGLSN